MKKYWKIYLLLIISILVLYAKSLNYDLVWCDDHEIILRGEDRIDEISDLDHEFCRGYINTSYYRPIINTSFIIDYALGGTSPFIYRLSNIIIHILCTILLFHLFLNFKIDIKYAGFFAFLFALHPINVNAVAWIVGRNDMLYALFGITSILFLFQYCDKGKFHSVVLLFFSILLSMLSKETALMLPALILIISYFYLKPGKKKLFRITTVSLIPYIIYFLLKSISELGENINKIGIDILIKNLHPEFNYK